MQTMDPDVISSQAHGEEFVDWLFHVIVRDFVGLLALLTVGYAVACIIFRAGILESISADEITQAIASLCLSSAILLSEWNQVTTNGEYEDYLKGFVLLGVLRWTWRTQIRGPLFDDEKALKVDLNGKTLLITGATSGVGLETVKELVRIFPSIRIVMACRDIKRGQAIKEECFPHDAKIEVEQMDLDELKSIREFVDRTKDKFPVIDVLVNNAGAMLPSRMQSKDGIECMIQTNCLAPFMLSLLLLDRMQKSDVRRIINLSSSTGKLAKRPRLDDMEYEKGYSMLPAYGHSKFCLNNLSVVLHEKLKSRGFGIYVCHPGAVQTAVTKHLALWLRLGQKSIRMFNKVGREGCQTVLFLVADSSKVSPKKAGGKYFEHLEPCEIPLIKSEDEKAALIKWCETQTGISLDDIVAKLE